MAEEVARDTFNLVLTQVQVLEILEQAQLLRDRGQAVVRQVQLDKPPQPEDPGVHFLELYARNPKRLQLRREALGDGVILFVQYLHPGDGPRQLGGGGGLQRRQG